MRRLLSMQPITGVNRLRRRVTGGASVTDLVTNDTTFVVPAGVVEIDLQGIGGGGGGGVQNNAGVGGGGGGAYSAVVTSVTAGQTVAIYIGKGGGYATPPDSTAEYNPPLTMDGGDTSVTIDGTPVLLAKGGSGVYPGTTGGAGGVAASGTGTVKFSGGAGAAAVSNVGGGGGSSAGVASDGVAGSGATGGTAPQGGGSGGAGGANGVAGTNGSNYGGGGGGNGKNGVTNGVGAPGVVRYHYHNTATIKSASFSDTITMSGTYPVPSNLLGGVMTFYVFGGGGAGEVEGVSGGGVGGGGGECRKVVNQSVIVGEPLAITIGSGGLPGGGEAGGNTTITSGSGISITANGGTGGAAGGAGGTGGTGGTGYNGGSGGAAGTGGSGGGGSSAGNGGNGNNGAAGGVSLGGAGGTAPTGGYAGGAGADLSELAADNGGLAAGGGGAGTLTAFAGNGGNGFVIRQWNALI